MENLDTTVTLTNCEQEPIHIIGHSQEHGVIVVCNPESLKITQCSENVLELLGISLESILNSHLSVLISSEGIKDLRHNLRTHKLLSQRQECINGEKCQIIPHLSGANLVLDIEPAGETIEALAFQDQFIPILSELEGAKSIIAMCELAVIKVKQLFGYDRVMMYKFDEEWNGEVIAEGKEESLESWLGLNYPATDIPKQARAIFLKQGVRVISNVNFKPAAIIPQISPITGKPLDISKSELRSVSPIHIEYLKNMGVGASLTAAIILEGELWGLLTCHHYTPKFINYHQRQTCKFLTQVFSNSLSVRTNKTFLNNFNASEGIKQELMSQLESIPSIKEAFLKASTKFTEIIACTGGALFQQGEIHLSGTTPTRSEVLDLIENFLLKKKEDLFSTKNLAAHYLKAQSYAKVVSGIISLQIHDENNTLLLWFRPEISETVLWGGNPEKDAIVKDGITYLSPRKSFEKWSQQHAGISKRWENYDIAAIEALQESISHLVLKKQKDNILQLNQQLLAANRELETFSYSISHDLRAPLRGIDGYARILRDHHMVDLDEYSRKAVRTIVKSAKEMDGLIDDILNYSSVGKTKLQREFISIEEIARDIVLKHNMENRYPNTSISIASNMPKIDADKRMLSQLLNNLIGNAFKYSSKTDTALVEVGYLKRELKNVYFVRDNGIGVDINFTKKVFDAFSRFAGDEYEGSGIGLAIAKKVVDLHDGELWLESEFGKGSTFFFSIPELEN